LYKSQIHESFSIARERDGIDGVVVRPLTSAMKIEIDVQR